jgi:SAM-dependent methyltransferase
MAERAHPQAPPPDADSPLEQLRRDELETLRPWFHPGDRVLELGGRSGFHAAILEAWGCRVTSVDVAAPPAAAYHEVQLYDGRHLPFPDGSFDVVFSSHMLYHVLDDPELFAEMRRVLAPGGTVVHLLPSVAWRAVAALGHYPYVARKLVQRVARRGGGEPGGSAGERQPSRGGGEARGGRLRWLVDRARMALVPPPLGPSRSFAAELWRWRPASIVRLLRSRGFETTAVVPSRLFYTPYEFLGPRLTLRGRHALSRAAGSSSVAFVGRAREGRG